MNGECACVSYDAHTCIERRYNRDPDDDEDHDYCECPCHDDPEDWDDDPFSTE